MEHIFRQYLTLKEPIVMHISWNSIFVSPMKHCQSASYDNYVICLYLMKIHDTNDQIVDYCFKLCKNLKPTITTQPQSIWMRDLNILY